MSRFNKFLINEAKFSKTDLPKVVKILVKVIEKKTGVKLYPMGGDGKNFENFVKSNGKKGIGMRYFGDNGVMIRFNLYSNQKTGQVSSIDLWGSSSDLNKPAFNLPLPSELNSVEMSKTIADFFKRPRTGQIKLVESKSLTDRLDEVKKTPENLTLAKTYGVDINLPAAEFRKAVLKVVTMMATNGVKEVNDLDSSVNDAQKRLDSQKVADPNVLFEDLDDLVGMVAAGVQPSLLVTGMAGIGKCLSNKSDIPVRFND